MLLDDEAHHTDEAEADETDDEDAEEVAANVAVIPRDVVRTDLGVVRPGSAGSGRRRSVSGSGPGEGGGRGIDAPAPAGTFGAAHGRDSTPGMSNALGRLRPL